ncbi:MAG: hypothetical protein ABJN36_12420 [Cyclobacteriaceae bacterium]
MPTNEDNYVDPHTEEDLIHDPYGDDGNRGPSDDSGGDSDEISDPKPDPFWLEVVETQVPVKATATYRKFKFKPFYHAYVCSMIKQLNRYGIEGLLDPKTDTESGSVLLRQEGNTSFDFKSYYLPKELVTAPLPEEGFDFDFDGPYGVYNWELFFHGPLLIASKLTQNQKFEEAQKWLHYIFNPTEVDGSAPARYWKVKPFYQYSTATSSVDDVINQMSSGDVAFNRQLDQWMKNPFKPHVIARLRTVAYMKTVVMKYVDNLIQWGDSLFRRDTIESINEATQIYILAAQVLGPKPVEVSKEDSSVSTLGDLVDASGSNASLVDMESELGAISTNHEVDLDRSLNSFNSLLYFCTSPNDKLLAYWDTVADRLFKIRHCMNIEGVTRSLALFEPPIDPALLVKASAAGLDLGTVLGNISNSSLPYYRFRVLVQKALDLCNDVKSLGQSLLSALEKKDAEELSLLRSSQEVNLLKAVRQIRKQAIEESKESLASLENARELAEIRRQYYSSREYMNQSEKQQLKRMDKSLKFSQSANVLNTLASGLTLIPRINIGLSGAFGSPVITTDPVDGAKMGGSASAASLALQVMAGIENNKASKSGIKGGYERRRDDWELQVELAEKELEQVSKQIVGAEIRLAINERELENHDMQIEQSSEVEAFMKDKYTNRDLYNWMITQISGMYFQSYQLAFDVSSLAERAFKHELAKEAGDVSFIQYGHWDSLKRGLLAGEKLQADLRRMEVAYLEQNKREYELTKHISLNMLSPTQMINLRENGSCYFQIPEVLFDLDHSGQYMRRIKSVRLTIPCVTGPYVNVNAKLTLLSNKIRKNSKADSYSAQDSDDFREDVGGIQAVAISSGQNDSGTFELNFQDERYLPFEGAGAVSSWRLELSEGYRQFDYDTISDVIIHMNYTAREGGNKLKQAAIGNIETALEAVSNEFAENNEILQQGFSLKTHFPNALYQLMQPVSGETYQQASFEIKKQHFPHFLSSSTLGLTGDALFLIKQKDGITSSLTALHVYLDATNFNEAGPINITNGSLFPKATITVSGSPMDTWTLKIDGASAVQTEINASEIEDIYMIFNYTITA